MLYSITIQMWIHPQLLYFKRIRHCFLISKKLTCYLLSLKTTSDKVEKNKKDELMGLIIWIPWIVETWTFGRRIQKNRLLREYRHINSFHCTSQILNFFFFFTNWSFVATLHWVSLPAPFFWQHLLTSCLYVILR